MPTIDTKIIGATGDYATLELWEAGEAADLVAGDVIARAAMQNQAHTAAMTLNDVAWNTDATRYIVMEAEESARHLGVVGAGARVTYPSGTQAFAINVAEQVVIAWLEITPTTLSNSQHCIDINVDGVTLYIDKCIGHGLTNSFSSFVTSARNNTTLTAANCIAYRTARTMFAIDGGAAVNHDWFIYNCIGFDCGLGGAGADSTLNLAANNPTNLMEVDIRNSALHTSVGAAMNSNTAPTANNWKAECNQNILDDASGTVQKLKGVLKETVTFQAGTGGSGDRIMLANITDGTEDLRLVRPTVLADNKAIDCGDNLTALAATLPQHVTLDVDINGVTRPLTGAWDVGAHQSSVPVTVFNPGATATVAKGFFTKVASDATVLGEGVLLAIDSTYAHSRLGVQMFDVSNDQILADAAGTFTVEYKTLNSQVFELAGTIDATAPVTLELDANVVAVRVSPLALSTTVTYVATVTTNQH